VGRRCPAELPDVDLVGVVDIDGDRARKVAVLTPRTEQEIAALKANVAR
jgi:hypothetical protein